MITKKDYILDFFLEEVENRLGSHLKRVILFGSRAKGTQSVHSDYDLLIVVDDVSPTINDIVDEVTGEVLYKYNSVISAFVLSELKFMQKDKHPFLMNAIREGIVFH